MANEITCCFHQIRTNNVAASQLYLVCCAEPLSYCVSNTSCEKTFWRKPAIGFSTRSYFSRRESAFGMLQITSARHLWDNIIFTDKLRFNLTTDFRHIFIGRVTRLRNFLFPALWGRDSCGRQIRDCLEGIFLDCRASFHGLAEALCVIKSIDIRSYFLMFFFSWLQSVDSSFLWPTTLYGGPSIIFKIKFLQNCMSSWVNLI